jgi:hypothetical protein
MKRSLLLFACVLVSCDDSPFGLHPPAPGEAQIGSLAPSSGLSCNLISGTTFTAPRGLAVGSIGGNSFFYVGAANGVFIVADQNGEPPLMLLANSNPLSGALVDVSARGQCPYVSTSANLAPVGFSSGDFENCDSTDVTYELKGELVAFGSSALYTVDTTQNLLQLVPASGMPKRIDVPTTPVHITVKDSQVWLANSPSKGQWDIVAYDGQTLAQLGHIALPLGAEHLYGMVWDDANAVLWTFTDDPTDLFGHSQICSFSFTPASN